MALSKLLAALLLLFSLLLLLHHVHALEIQQLSNTSNSVPVPVPQDNANNVSKIDCGGACASRCQLSSRQRLCKRACGTCCLSCNCVPPGTSGNHDACPCYASLTTHGNRRKCP